MPARAALAYCSGTCSPQQSLAVAAPDFEVMAQRTVTALAELDAAIQKHG